MNSTGHNHIIPLSDNINLKTKQNTIEEAPPEKRRQKYTKQEQYYTDTDDS